MPRIPNDAYYTPQPLADVLARVTVERLRPCRHQPTALEPSVGSGNLARAIRKELPNAHITGVDIDPLSKGFGVCDVAACGDFLKFTDGEYDLILANPPYSDAIKHIKHALSLLADGGVAGFLVRSDLLNTKSFAKAFDAGMWEADTPHIEDKLVTRPSFEGTSGTGRYNYSLVTWLGDDREEWSPCEVNWLDWKGVLSGKAA